MEGGYERIALYPRRRWSGRPDSNRRRPAWEAGILPLNYGRPSASILLQGHVVDLHHLVAARLPVHALVHAVEIDLLVDRHGRHLFHPQLVDSAVLLETLLL